MSLLQSNPTGAGISVQYGFCTSQNIILLLIFSNYFKSVKTTVRLAGCPRTGGRRDPARGLLLADPGLDGGRQRQEGLVRLRLGDND